MVAGDTKDCANKIQKCQWESQTRTSSRLWGLQVSLPVKTWKYLWEKPKLHTFFLAKAK